MNAVRDRIGPNFLFGIRLSAADLNYSPRHPFPAPLPWPLISRERWIGNDETQMLEYAKATARAQGRLSARRRGLRIPNPRDVPGPFPFDEIKMFFNSTRQGFGSPIPGRSGPSRSTKSKMFFNSTRHLSRKAAVRSTVVNTVPAFLLRRLLNLGWKYEQGINLDLAETFKAVVGLPVIANGGFQRRTSSKGRSNPSVATWCRWRGR